MADPLSITASVVGVTTAAVQAAKSLCEAIKRFKDRNKTLRRLRDGLQDLLNILESLEQVANAQSSILELLRGPIGRCSQECHEFEQSLEAFDQTSETRFRDWAKMEFKRGDINEFIENIAGYKATISIGLGTITLHTSKVTQQVLEEYNEMVKDTAYNFEIRLQQIDEKMARLPLDNTNTSGISIDLRDEREVTKQCLRICEEARSYFESLASRESPLLHEAPQKADEDDIRNYFEAQLLTRRALDENQDRFADIIGHLRKRLESQLLGKDRRDDNERLHLQEDIEISRQCLEVCKIASEVSSKKIYRVGEAIAKGDSDQVVVTTLADLFDVKKALSQDNALQLIGSMTGESLRHLAEMRYASRLGASTRGPDHAKTGTTSSPSVLETQKGTHPFSPQNDEKSAASKAGHNRPSSNETRKRATHDAID